MRWEVPLLPEALAMGMIKGAVAWMLIVMVCEFILAVRDILDSQGGR